MSTEVPESGLQVLVSERQTGKTTRSVAWLKEGRWDEIRQGLPSVPRNHRVLIVRSEQEARRIRRGHGLWDFEVVGMGPDIDQRLRGKKKYGYDDYRPGDPLPRSMGPSWLTIDGEAVGSR